ncbi:MAG TPA: hydroxymethylbilane synthase [Jatrophihabitans sp.]|nr:hydroxymethylbilane synthase [Jatrophihabitans sp.]
MTLKFGTRASLLARTQTQAVVDCLPVPVETVLVSTEGDRSAQPLTQLGGTGVFVSALREALLRGEIDVAVHSYKDLPTAPAEGIVVAAVPAREDPRDALCSQGGRTLLELPAGARLGTGSPRRAAQLRALDLGLEIVPIRGNVDTRLSKVGSSVDGVVLATAGLKRIGLADRISEIIDPIQVLPAPAQGALAIECRADDHETLAVLARLDHACSRAAVAAERALLAGLEAGCSAPVGALAEVSEGEDGRLEVFLRGSVTAIDGTDAVRLSATGDVNTAEQVGRRLAGELIELGANMMMGSSDE